MWLLLVVIAVSNFAVFFGAMLIAHMYLYSIFAVVTHFKPPNFALNIFCV